jgi:hypothetical protein
MRICKSDSASTWYAIQCLFYRESPVQQKGKAKKAKKNEVKVDL